MSRAFLTIVAVAALTLTGCGQNADNTLENTASAGPRSASQPEPQRAPARPAAPALLTVPSGTSLEVQLNETLNSGTTTVGENFSAAVVEDVMVDGHVAIPAGSTLSGSVTEVKAAKHGAGNAQMTIGFNRLDLPGGYSTNVVASLSKASASKKGRNGAIIGGSAAGGALLGRLIGKNTKCAVVGAIVGGGIGTGVVMSKEGSQVNLPAGAGLTIRLDQSLNVPRDRKSVV